ncbi:MAG: hypothetical protein GF330_11600, partial [Candidatus Eisenbacteria bacterium]|nr:hypothetical protein [Candidatus Eisenbacteria bacterium]
LGAEVRGVGFAPAEDGPSRRLAGRAAPRRLRLTTSAGEIDTRRVLIATGTEARRPASPRVPRAASERVHTEILALRDLRDARVAIIGGGDAACDYALSLSRGNAVTILVRGARLRALPLLQQRVSACETIGVRRDCRIARIDLHPGRELYLLPEDGTAPLPADHLIFAVGRGPALGFLPAEIARACAADDATGILHFAGDVRGGIFRQAAIAAGEGVRVAMEIAGLCAGPPGRGSETEEA